MGAERSEFYFDPLFYRKFGVLVVVFQACQHLYEFSVCNVVSVKPVLLAADDPSALKNPVAACCVNSFFSVLRLYKSRQISIHTADDFIFSIFCSRIPLL